MGALVADGAHQLAAAVLEHRRAEMRAEAEIDPAQIVLAVLVDREAAQLHDAAAVLQLVGDVVEQAAEAGSGKSSRVISRQSRRLFTAQRRIELVDAGGGRSRIQRREFLMSLPCQTEGPVSRVRVMVMADFYPPARHPCSQAIPLP